MDLTTISTDISNLSQLDQSANNYLDNLYQTNNLIPKSTVTELVNNLSQAETKLQSNLAVIENLLTGNDAVSESS